MPHRGSNQAEGIEEDAETPSLLLAKMIPRKAENKLC
jgi:hypothetical protein